MATRIRTNAIANVTQTLRGQRRILSFGFAGAALLRRTTALPRLPVLPSGNHMEDDQPR